MKLESASIQIDRILNRHKVPKVEELLEQFVKELLGSETFPKSIGESATQDYGKVVWGMRNLGFLLTIENTADGQWWGHWSDVGELSRLDDNWESGLGYASDENTCVLLAAYDALTENELFFTDIFKGLDF